MVTIDEDIGNALHAVELQEQTLALPLLRDVNLAGVVRYGLQVLAVVAQCVKIPGVRQVYAARLVAACIVLEEEQPFIVERVDLARLCRETHQ